MELVIVDTTVNDWERALMALMDAEFRVEVTESLQGLDVSFDGTLFTPGDDVAYGAVVAKGAQHYSTNFFSPSMIDFQGDSDVVSSMEALEDVIATMQIMSNALNRTVLLLPETLEPESTRPYLSVNGQNVW